MAAIVPRSMLSTFRWERWAKTMLTPDASVASPAALAESHALACASNARWSLEVVFRSTTVMRVLDLATSIRLLRSLPKGSDNS